MDDKKLPSKEVLMKTLRNTISTAWNVGTKVNEPSIDKWLSNFTGEALHSDCLSKEDAEEFEKQLALFLLCNFVYYNDIEIKYLTKMMFEKYIHCIFGGENKNNVNDDDINELLSKTQFAPLGTISESSSYLLYHFRQENDLSKENFKKNERIANIVFIDDFSISGDQAFKYINKYIEDNKEWVIYKRIYILLMITTNKAFDELRKVAGITVLPCIIMDDRSEVFSETSVVFKGYHDNIKETAKRMCKFYGDKLIEKTEKMTPFGYDGGGYMFGTYYNIPDNTLPIFWSNKNNWNYLFKRYDKKYSGGIKLEGRYV